jgi:hypothetical protein
MKLKPKPVRLQRAGDGVYATPDDRWEVQNPHGMDPADPDRNWYVHDCSKGLPPEDIHGPFDTLGEVRRFIAEQTQPHPSHTLGVGLAGENRRRAERLKEGIP